MGPWGRLRPPTPGPVFMTSAGVRRWGPSQLLEQDLPPIPRRGPLSCCASPHLCLYRSLRPRPGAGEAGGAAPPAVPQSAQYYSRELCTCSSLICQVSPKNVCEELFILAKADIINATAQPLPPSLCVTSRPQGPCCPPAWHLGPAAGPEAFPQRHLWAWVPAHYSPWDSCVCPTLP